MSDKLSTLVQLMLDCETEDDAMLEIRMKYAPVEVRRLMDSIVTTEAVANDLALYAPFAETLYERVDELWRTDPRSDVEKARCWAYFKMVGCVPHDTTFLTLLALYMWLSISPRERARSVPSCVGEDNLKVGPILVKWARGLVEL